MPLEGMQGYLVSSRGVRNTPIAFMGSITGLKFIAGYFQVDQKLKFSRHFVCRVVPTYFNLVKVWKGVTQRSYQSQTLCHKVMLITVTSLRNKDCCLLLTWKVKTLKPQCRHLHLLHYPSMISPGKPEHFRSSSCPPHYSRTVRFSVRYCNIDNHLLYDYTDHVKEGGQIFYVAHSINPHVRK